MMAQAWIVACPQCGAEFEADPKRVNIRCGEAIADCACPRCECEFEAQQDYLLWLGAEGPLPEDLEKPG